MCGIFGYVGTGGKGVNVSLEGTKYLFPRGYDSFGGAFNFDGKVELYKISQEEKKHFDIHDVRKLIPNSERKCHSALCHTRWLTIGELSVRNAHPHVDEEKKIYLVQNGNVENFKQLKKNDLADCKFYSETDTEVIVNLVARYYKENESMVKAIQKAMSRIEGANAIVCFHIDEPEVLYAANKGGSLIMGKNNDKVIVTSTPSALACFGIKAPYKALYNDEIAVITSDGWEIEIVESMTSHVEDFPFYELDGYDHYMEMEIFTQPEVLKRTIQGRIDLEQGNVRLGGISKLSRELRKVKTFHFVGCGTSYNVCEYAVLLLNRFGIPARAWIASEFCYSHPVFDVNDAFIFMSQSGETTDVREVIDEIKVKGNLCLGIVNVPGTIIARETDEGIYIRAGNEEGVAATKSYTAQLVSIAMFAIFLARQRKMTLDTGKRLVKELIMIPTIIEEMLEKADDYRKLAEKYKNIKSCYFLGRIFDYITAKEGALKLKEISYIHAEGYGLREMKHGPLALVDKDFLSVAIVTNPALNNECQVSIQEITDRKGMVLSIESTDVHIEDAVDYIKIPQVSDFFSPIISAIPVQLFAYYMALLLEKNPDRPRNLAKTNTVK